MFPPSFTVAAPLFDTVDKLRRPEPKPQGRGFYAVPATPICQRAYQFIKEYLPEWTANHCFRSYAFSLAIAHYTGWDEEPAFDREEIFLACAMHEMGMHPDGLESRMSLELWGGIKAREWILAQTGDADKEQVQSWADEACEAIMRHTIEFRGFSSRVRLTGALLSLASGLDLMGFGANHVAQDDLLAICELWPRVGYCEGLSAFSKEEALRKPACLFEDCILTFEPGMRDVGVFKGLQGELTNSPRETTVGESKLSSLSCV